MSLTCMKRPRSKSVVLTVGVVLAVSATLTCLALWIPGLPGCRHESHLAYASLVNIRSGLWSYERLHGHLPPAAAADAESGEVSSWRIEVQRQLAKPDGHLYDVTKAWNDPSNLQLQGQGAWLFRYTQTDVDAERSNAKYGRYTTYFKAITGRGTAFDSSTPASLGQLPKDVILVVRVEKSDTHWMEPDDLKIEQLAPSQETERLLLGKEGYVVLFADGEGWVLSSRTPISDLCKFFTIEGAKQSDREQVLGPYRVLP
jgi:hypothetical protein